MNTKRIFKVLSDILPLSEDFKLSLGEKLIPVSLPKNHFLLEANAIPDRAFFLESGFCMSYSILEERKTVMSFWNPGEIILSPKSFFEQVPSTEFIQVTENSDLLFITYDNVMRLFQEFEVANSLARSITSSYLSKREERIIALQTLTAWERYDVLLKTYPRVEQCVSQEIIAAYLGVTPQSLSRLKNHHR